LTTGALALGAAVWMVAATATEPLLPNNQSSFQTLGDVADTGRWFHRLSSGDFTRTVLSSAGLGHGWVAIAPFLVAVALALPAGPLLVFAAHPLAHRTGWASCLALTVLLVIVALEASGLRGRPAEAVHGAVPARSRS